MWLLLTALALAADTDGDMLDDAEEARLGTDPHHRDTDRDGLEDGVEVHLHTDPLRADTDQDGLTDGRERLLATDPRRADTDRDGVSDGVEVHLHHTDPRRHGGHVGTVWLVGGLAPRGLAWELGAAVTAPSGLTVGLRSGLVAQEDVRRLTRAHAAVGAAAPGVDVSARLGLDRHVVLGQAWSGLGVGLDAGAAWPVRGSVGLTARAGLGTTLGARPITMMAEGRRVDIPSPFWASFLVGVVARGHAG